MTKQTADVLTSNLGTIATVEALTAKGRRWIARHLDSTVIEHRYITDILCGMLRDGLRLQDARTGRIATRAALKRLEG